MDDATDRTHRSEMHKHAERVSDAVTEWLRYWEWNRIPGDFLAGSGWPFTQALEEVSAELSAFVDRVGESLDAPADAVRLSCSGCDTGHYAGGMVGDASSLWTCSAACGHSVTPSDIYPHLDDGETLAVDRAGYLAYVPAPDPVDTDD